MTTLQKLRKIVEKEFGEKCNIYNADGEKINDYGANCTVCEAHNSLEQLEILLDYYKEPTKKIKISEIFESKEKAYLFWHQ